MIGLAADSEEAFSRLYHRYWEKVYQVADHYLKDKSMVEDVVQEVFLVVWKKRSELPAILHFQGYLKTMARNLIISSLRKNIPVHYPISETNCIVQEDCWKPTLQLEYKETSEMISMALGQLSPRQKQVYMLSSDSQLSLKEAASTLNISYDAARQYKSEALKVIRDFLKRKAVRMILIGAYFIFS